MPRTIERLEQRNLLATVELLPIADNTIYESDAGDTSNGAGQHLFAGRIAPRSNGLIRRSLIEFDLSEVPAGATINSVSLQLTMSMTIAGTETTALHRLLADWGEGTSNAPGEEGRGTTASTDDATWLHTRFPDQQWVNPGGDFVASASATVGVGDVGDYVWSSAELAEDVAFWAANPNENFGWIVIGNEQQSTTAKRFDSREHPTLSNRPKLTIDFDEPVNTVPWQNPLQREDVSGDGAVAPIDALIILNRIGRSGSGPLPVPSDQDSPPPFFDTNGDGNITPIDALIVINSLSRQLPPQKQNAAAFFLDTSAIDTDREEREVSVESEVFEWFGNRILAL